MNEQKPAGEAQNSQKKPFYKRWWFITIAAVVFLMLVSSFGEDKNKEEPQAKNENQANEQANIDNEANTKKVGTASENTEENVQKEEPKKPQF